MKQGFVLSALLAAGLAGCGATPVTHTNYREIDPSQGMMADTMTWEWRRKQQPGTPEAAQPAASAAASVAEQEEFKKWQESAGATERKEFEDWRAWQEWKKKNPK